MGEGYCAQGGVCVAEQSGAGATDDTSAPLSSKALIAGLLVLMAAASAFVLASGKLPLEVREVLPSWKLFFFAGACCVLASGAIPVVNRLVHLEWAPLTFVD